MPPVRAVVAQRLHPIDRIGTINLSRGSGAGKIPAMIEHAAADDCVVETTPDVILIRNPNTTIGYCRYAADGGIEYIFVNPAYRRRGFGSRLLAEVARVTGRIGQPHEPISPTGRRFFGAHGLLPDEAPAASGATHPSNAQDLPA